MTAMLCACRDDLREHLKNAQKLIMAQKQQVSSSDTSESESKSIKHLALLANLEFNPLPSVADINPLALSTGEESSDDSESSSESSSSSSEDERPR